MKHLFLSALLVGSLIAENVDLVALRFDDELYIGPAIIESRPLRYGGPRMEYEERIKEDGSVQVIIHNYGHSAAGWTSAPGNASYVAGLLNQHPELVTALQAKQKHIIVIGAGINGLFTAYCLRQQGYAVRIVSKDAPEDTVSYISNGLWTPSPIGMENPALAPILVCNNLEGYQFYSFVASGAYPQFEQALVKKVPMFFDGNRDERMKRYIEWGALSAGKCVTVTFDNGTQKTLWRYDGGLVVDTVGIMQRLVETLKNDGVFIEILKDGFGNPRQLESFDDPLLAGAIIFNCAGLDGQPLTNDAVLVPSQAHDIELHHQPDGASDYVLITSLEKGYTTEGDTVVRQLTIIPRIGAPIENGNVVRIGATYLPGQGLDNLHARELVLLLARLQHFLSVSDVFE